MAKKNKFAGKPIYAVYECDAHESYSSFSFKGFFTEYSEAVDFFDEHADTYRKDKNGEGWKLKLGEYDPDIRIDGDAIRDFNTILVAEYDEDTQEEEEEDLEEEDAE